MMESLAILSNYNNYFHNLSGYTQQAASDGSKIGCKNTKNTEVINFTDADTLHPWVEPHQQPHVTRGGDSHANQQRIILESVDDRFAIVARAVKYVPFEGGFTLED